jgi:NodT family efflux transporter outer membrane factor (OMF) lipoprotein
MRRLVAIALAFSLSACTTLGPDYEEPPVEWLEGWQTNLYGQVGGPGQQSELDLQFWWQVFDDPVLNKLIELAKTENPSLRIAGLRILESRAQLGIAESTRYPQAQQATGAVTYVNSSDNDGSVTGYQAGFNLGWELDFWGRFRRSIESADAAYFASIYNHQDLQVLLNAQAADLYFAYRTVLLRIGIAQNNAAVQKRSLEITTQLFESGEESELDLQQAKTQYLATVSSIPGLQITETKVRNAIAALLGRAPGDLPELAELSAPLPTMDPVVIHDIPGNLLMRRPDIRAAAWQSAVQSAQIGVAEADLYPAISLLGTIGWSGNSVSGSPSTSTFGAGPAVTWNLFDYGRIRNNVRVQDSRLQQAIESYQNSVLQAAREIDDAAISIVKTRENQEVLTESVRAAERSLELATARYRQGYADFQRVLDAQRAVASQTERELINQGSHISAIIEFYKALGGGWQLTPIEELVPDATRESMESRSNWGDLLSAPLPVTPES